MRTLNQHFATSTLAIIMFVLCANASNAQSGGKSSFRDMRQYDAMVPPAFSAKIIEAGSMKFQVIFSNPGKERVTVGAYSENGNCLYSRDIMNTQCNMYLNFTNIEDGIYYITISNGKQGVNQRFRISTNTVKKTEIL